MRCRRVHDNKDKSAARLMKEEVLIVGNGDKGFIIPLI